MEIHDLEGSRSLLRYPQRIVLGAEIEDKECVGFVAPPGNLRQVRKPLVDNRDAGRIVYVSFAVHAHLELRSQVVRLVRVKTDLNEYFRPRMRVRFSHPVPLAAFAIEAKGEVGLHSFEVFPEQPDELVGVSRAYTLL